MMEEKKTYSIGFIHGMLCMGKKTHERISDIEERTVLSDILIMDFDNKNELKMMLVDPLPFQFINKKTRKIHKMNIEISKFAYVLDLSEVEDAEKLIEYYENILLRENDFKGENQPKGEMNE